MKRNEGFAFDLLIKYINSNKMFTGHQAVKGSDPDAEAAVYSYLYRLKRAGYVSKLGRFYYREKNIPSIVTTGTLIT